MVMFYDLFASYAITCCSLKMSEVETERLAAEFEGFLALTRATSVIW